MEVWSWVVRQMKDEDKNIPLHGAGGGRGVGVTGGVGLGDEADDR